MTIKVKLPNPGLMSIPEWFEQTELALYHAKKSYEKVARDAGERSEDISLFINLHPIIEKFVEDNPDKIEFPDNQELELQIEY